MVHWVRFARDGATGFGTLDGDNIAIHDGDMFAGATPTGDTVARADVALLTPCEPGKIVALWNNSHSAAEKQGLTQPEYPLFFIKAANSYLAPGGTIRKPASYDGRVIYEAELGIVIGRTCTAVGEASTPIRAFRNGRAPRGSIPLARSGRRSPPTSILPARRSAPNSTGASGRTIRSATCSCSRRRWSARFRRA